MDADGCEMDHRNAFQFFNGNRRQAAKCVLQTVFVLLIMSDHVTGDRTCDADIKYNPSCQCKTDGFLIDLSPILNSGITPPVFQNKFVENPQSTDKSSYSYQPCENFNFPKTGSPPTKCSDVTACQHNSDSYYGLGDEKTSLFVWDEKNGHFNITSNMMDRQSIVMLKCSDGVGKLTVLGETFPGSKRYEFILSTKYACITSGGLSTGSIMCIIFFVGVFLYLVVGFLILRFGRGARGLEQIPNFEFWIDFPSLVKDGCMFTIKGCKTDTGYSQI